MKVTVKRANDFKWIVGHTFNVLKACGENMRTMPCNGRKTKSEVKQEKKNENRLRKSIKQGTES